MNFKIALAAGLIAFGAAGVHTALARSPLEPAATAKPKRECFFASQASGFRAVGDKVVNIRVGVKDVYRFEMLGHCPDINWAEGIALVARGGGSSICSGLDATIVSPSTLGPQRCAVRSVRKLTAAEVKALPKKEQP